MVNPRVVALPNTKRKCLKQAKKSNLRGLGTCQEVRACRAVFVNPKEKPSCVAGIVHGNTV